MKRSADELEEALSTSFEALMPLVFIVPLIPVVILGVSFSTDELQGLGYVLLLGGLWAAYFVIWLISRVGRDRRILFYPEGVYFPARGVGLLGRFVPYERLGRLRRHGPGNSSLIVEFPWGSRNYTKGATDVDALEDMLRARSERA